jgi:hypothetical protein
MTVHGTKSSYCKVDDMDLETSAAADAAQLDGEYGRSPAVFAAEERDQDGRWPCKEKSIRIGRVRNGASHRRY